MREYPENEYGNCILSINISPFNGGAIITSQDITEFKRLQLQRIQSEKFSTVGQLAAGVAHEFNNIMSGISGYAQMVQKKPKYMSKLVNVALTQASRANDIINSLRTFIRPQQIVFLPVKLIEVLESVFCLVKKELECREIKLNIDVNPDLPPLRAVAGQIQQILLNLVLNAIHATKDKGKIDISAIEQKNHVTIRIADNGCGIPEEDIDRIFDPFFTTKGSFGGGDILGTGLGLTVVYNLARAHGAQISVKSTVGKGTTFSLDMPIAHKDKTDAPLEKHKVILVTNDPAQTIQANHVLESEDISVFHTFGEARTSIDSGEYTTAFIDGDLESEEILVDFLAWIRNQHPHMFIVIFSVDLENKYVQKLADRHLLKPCSAEILHSLIHDQKESISV